MKIFWINRKIVIKRTHWSDMNAKKLFYCGVLADDDDAFSFDGSCVSAGLASAGWGL